MHKKVFHALSLALIFVLLVTTVVVASDLDIAVLDVTAPVGEVEIEPSGEAPIAITLTVTGRQGADATVKIYKTWTLVNGNFVGSDEVVVTIHEREARDSATVETIQGKVVVSSDHAIGEYTLTVGAHEIVTDSPAALSQRNTGTYKVVVISPVEIDTTPPGITPSISGTLGNNGWYVSDVIVNWTVVDEESAVSSTTGCDATTIDYDTDGEILTCSATSAGGTASESVTIKRDATKPTISASVSPDPADSGWYNQWTGAPTVKYTCSDATSGVASCTDEYTFEEGAGQSHEGEAVDNAGNSAKVSVEGIDVDLTAPTLEWLGEIADGSDFYFGSVPNAPTCAASDALSGPDGCEVSGYSTAVGTHTLTATAKDKAGNETVETREYTVKAWTLSGFYRPVEMYGVWNTVKGGSTVPLKFNIFAGPTELTSTTAVKSFSVTTMTCFGGPEDTVEELATTGGTVLRYDSTGGQFIQNWQTPKNPGKCYQVTMTTQDGSKIFANFKLK